MLEISIPRLGVLRWPYLFYICHVIPLIGRAFLGHPDNYRMLGIYTRAFGNCAKVKDEFARVGLVTSEASFFLGCAAGVFGYKRSEGPSRALPATQ